MLAARQRWDSIPNPTSAMTCEVCRSRSTGLVFRHQFPGLLERDLLALRSPYEWCSHMQLRPQPPLLRRFAPRSGRVPAGSCFHPNRLGSASCSLCPLASAAKSSLRLRSEFERGNDEDRVRNGVWNINDSQITAGVRLPKRDSHARLSGSVFHWTIQDRLDFVFGHVMTVDVRLPTPRIIVIAYPHPCIVPCDREAALVVESRGSWSSVDRDLVTAAMKALGELEAQEAEAPPPSPLSSRHQDRLAAAPRHSSRLLSTGTAKIARSSPL